MSNSQAETTARSAALFARARQVMPGGVSSPVRAFAAVGGTPRFVERAAGCRLIDADGREYIDFVMSWGPLILGHAHPGIVAAVQDAAARGTTYGAPHQGEVELAELVVASYPGLERVRFTSSGTEATQSAIRLARGVTGRERIVKFAGCYHGHADGLLVEAGSGAATFGQPSSLGVPVAVASLTSVLPLDDEAALAKLFTAHGRDVAAVIVEPVPANHGLLPQRREFLAALRQQCTAHGALLIFDEVISGFRVALGGAAEYYDLRPDLATFGKILGGGLPCGAFAGPAACMEQLAPTGRTYHAGTLSGNPLAMAAGLATLRALQDRSAYRTLGSRSARLHAAMTAAIDANGWPVRLEVLGSLFWFAFGATATLRRPEQIDGGAAGRYRQFFHACLRRGVNLAPSAFEVGFLSTAHGESDIDAAVAVFTAALQETFAC
jgi:glutamate-1-semialdehyde 2,1-aminomutase